MALRLPGFSFQDMSVLTYEWNWALYHVFTDELLMAIFWEETQFNNIPQVKGSAVGLGQIEPSELPKLKKYGITTDRKSILNNPGHAVECTAYFLQHLYESQKSPASKYVALKRYAGYYYDYAQWRLKIVDGWIACEKALAALPTPAWNHPEQVLSALSKSRAFSKTDAGIRGALFP